MVEINGMQLTEYWLTLEAQNGTEWAFNGTGLTFTLKMSRFIDILVATFDQPVCDNREHIDS